MLLHVLFLKFTNSGIDLSEAGSHISSAETLTLMHCQRDSNGAVVDMNLQ